MKINRWQYAINAIIILMLFGLVYAWSVFVKPLESEFGWLRSQTSLTFSISMAAFCLGGIVGGFLSKKISAKVLMLCSAVMIVIGFILASSVSSIIGLYLCYGILIGGGVGIGYNVVMNITMRWFLDKQGLIAGLLLMGFGVGGSLLGSFAVLLMSKFGWRNTFVFIGIGMGMMVLIFTLLIKLPSLEYQQQLIMKTHKIDNAIDFHPREMLKDTSFWFYLLWSILLSSGGLIMIGNASPFAQTFTTNLSTATFVAGLISIFNGAGRMIFGYLFDLLGSRKCLLIINAGFCIAALVLLAAIQMNSLNILTLGFCCTGLSYGGITPSNSAFVSKVYGAKYYAMNFSIANLAVLIAAFLGPYVSGILQNNSSSYLSTVAMILGFAIMGIPCTFFIKRRTGANR